MAWSFDAGTIGPGETQGWDFWWGSEAYHGIQVVQAKPLADPISGGGSVEGGYRIPAATLIVRNPGLRLDPGGGGPAGGYVYSITVTNTGPEAVTYQVVGVGV